MTPLTQQELRSKLDRSDSLKSVEIGDIDFTDHRFEIEVILQAPNSAAKTE